MNAPWRILSAGIASLIFGTATVSAQDTLVATALGTTVARTWPRVLPPSAGALVNGDFANGLSGWTPVSSGPAGSGGHVTPQNGARFVEGGNLFVELLQTFSIPENAVALRLSVAEVPGFDTTQAGLPDAFEVALIGPQGSLVPTWHQDSSAFYSRQETGSVLAGLGTTASAAQVTVPLDGIPAGTAATLLLTLIGADGDTGSGLTVGPIEVVIACSGAATTSAYGDGLPGPLGVPALALSDPPALATSVDAIIGNPYGAATVGCLAISLAAANIPIGPSAFLLVDLADPSLLTFDFLLNPDEGRVPFLLPADPAWCGVTWFAQAGIHDPATVAVALTRGLAVTIGF